ncbi:unnamed protein product [Phaedon cochleariae]|uniref:Uncharacterized protein n=1 Tax=Phaedon cochleariae TaxID=80249 RepID=A0A9P0DLE7_PHACE|nr:unnamed protein product [Phaedon cochleariae]
MSYSQNFNRRCPYDRFIPRRQNTDIDMSHLLINNNGLNATPNQQPIKDSEFPDFANTAKYTFHLQNYRDILKRSLLPHQKKVLEFSCVKHRQMKMAGKNKFETNPWPVRARPKPLLGAPSIVLDMPDLDTYLSHQVVDWGKQGYIAATYEGEVHVWHPEKKESRRVINSQWDVKNCIKWNREGTHFAVAFGFSEIAIWDFESFKTTATAKCPCLTTASKRCVITSMEWTKQGNLITGCTRGMICYWSSSLRCIKACPYAHTGDVITVKLSCAEKGLVTTGEDSRIKTWFWPDFAPNAEMEYAAPTKAVDWHPWKDSLLAVGGHVYTTIWNVDKREIVSFKEHPHPNCLVDCLTFNPLSAELLVSYYSDGNYLTVLKNLDCIVDEVRNSFGRVPYLLWDNTGTKLATASADENLCIFEFFGAATDLEKKYLRMKKKKLTTNMMETVDRIGHGIR